MKKQAKLKYLPVRIREDQADLLDTLPNASAFVREAIDLALAHHRNEILAKCRTELFGENNEPASPPAPVLLIQLPKEVWSDEALKAKLEQGATLDDLLSYLHSQIHPLFVQAFHGHSEADYSAEKGKMWPGTRTTGNPTEKKSDEKFAGGQ